VDKGKEGKGTGGYISCTFCGAELDELGILIKLFSRLLNPGPGKTPNTATAEGIYWVSLALRPTAGPQSAVAPNARSN